MSISRQQFDAWKKGRERKCHYCGIKEVDLKRVGLKSQVNKPVEALGLDRLDSSGHYTVDNIVYCCFACNKAKGNIFTAGEMAAVGEGIAMAWRMRGITI